MHVKVLVYKTIIDSGADSEATRAARSAMPNLTNEFIDTYGEHQGVLVPGKQIGYDLNGPFGSYRFKSVGGQCILEGIKVSNVSGWKDRSSVNNDIILYQNMWGGWWQQLLPKLLSHMTNHSNRPVTVDYVQRQGPEWNHITFTCVMERLDSKPKGLSQYKILRRETIPPPLTKTAPTKDESEETINTDASVKKRKIA